MTIESFCVAVLNRTGPFNDSKSRNPIHDLYMEEEALYKMVCIEYRCPKCNGETHQIEKDTFSGREMREYQCKTCRWTHIFDCGPALWKIMSDAKDDERDP